MKTRKTTSTARPPSQTRSPRYVERVELAGERVDPQRGQHRRALVQLRLQRPELAGQSAVAISGRTPVGTFASVSSVRPTSAIVSA